MKEEYCPVCLPDDNLILIKLRCGHKICQGLERVIRLSGENINNLERKIRLYGLLYS